MRRAARPLTLLAPAACAVLLVAVASCSGAPDAPPENVGSTAAAITTSSILARADEWVHAKLLYCQSPNGADDSIDPSCPSTCVRESNPQWDPYRSDCSGFISWAWGLPPPGRTTDDFAPADTTVSYAINGHDLQPGDALNLPGDHVVLFVSWVTVGSEANFYEEPGCSATPDYAHAFTSAVSISGSQVAIAYEGLTFTAIRYTGVTSGTTVSVDAGDLAEVDAGIPCTVGNESGECMLTIDCAAVGGTSTPNHCPGPDDVQCCTGIPEPAPAVDAGGGSSSESATGETTSSRVSGTSTATSQPADAVDGGRPPVDMSTGTPSGSGSQTGLVARTRDAGADPDASGWDASQGHGCAVGGGGAGEGAVWLVGLGLVGALRGRRGRRRRAD
jgi:MYXO-CTERM domain-containing protein